MSRRTLAEIHLLRLETGVSLVSKIRNAFQKSAALPSPDYVIAAGSGTHVVLWLLAKKHRARSIVLMKPLWPVSWFDWCVAPEHDFKTDLGIRNLILSKGALNRVVPTKMERSGKYILIGGLSKIHGFDESELISQIRELAQSGDWQVADSRRTPDDFLKKLHQEIPGITIFPHQNTKSGWLAEKLAMATEVWVTEDSVSMVYEALTGGARVGVLRMPRMKPDARVIRGLEKLKSEGFLIGQNEASHKTLAEADRCAERILGF